MLTSANFLSAIFCLVNLLSLIYWPGLELPGWAVVIWKTQGLGQNLILFGHRGHYLHIIILSLSVCLPLMIQSLKK